MSVVNYVINWSEVDLSEALSLLSSSKVKFTKEKIEWQKKHATLFIPPLKSDFRMISHFFPNQSVIKILQFNAFGWKDEDQFSVHLNGNEILSNIYVKETSEKYTHNRSFIVQENSELVILFHNHSGNSNQVSFSFEYGEI